MEYQPNASRGIEYNRVEGSSPHVVWKDIFSDWNELH